MVHKCEIANMNKRKFEASSSFFQHIFTSKKAKEIFITTVNQVLSGIVFAIVAALLTANIIERKEHRRAINAQLNNLSNVYIGCSKQWADEVFGYPQFVGQKDDYLLTAYITDYFVLQIAYDQSQAAKAYIITSLDNTDKIDIQLTDSTLYGNSLISNSFILGELSYYDFPGTPEHIGGFVSNGNARAFYSESYYYMSGGNYYEYYIASFDYGKAGKNHQDFISSLTFPDNEPIDDEVSGTCFDNYSLVIKDRKNNYPNSYGVSTLDVDMDSLLFSYDWFNSQQLRNKFDDIFA